jgi:hypothetical protein
MRIVRWTGFGALGCVLLVAASSLAVPPLVQHLAQQQIAQQLGRKATLASVSFNPWTLTLTASGFALYEADGTTVAFSAQTLLLDASIASIFKLAPVLQQVTLSGPKLHLVRSSAERNNFSDIIERILAQPKSEGEARFSVSNIELVDGSILFDDGVSGKQVAIAALNIGVPQVSNFAGAIDLFVQPRLAMNVNGAPFALKGRSKPFANSQETALALDIEQFDITSFASFAPVPLPVTIQSGKLSTRLDLSFVRTEGQPQIKLAGDIKLVEAALADQHGAPLFKARSITAHVDDIDLLSASAALGKVDLQGPEVWAALDLDGRLNWAALAGSTPVSKPVSKPVAKPGFNPDPKSGPKPASEPVSEPVFEPALIAASKPAAGAKPAPLFTLAQLTLEDGTIHWLDAAYAKPAFALQLSNVALDVKELSLAKDAKPASVALSAGAKGAQQIAFVGTVNPATASVSGKASIAALPLAQYQPYFDGIDGIDGALAANLSGQLGLQTMLAVDDGKLKLTQLNAQIDGASLVAKKSTDTKVQIKKISLTDASVDTAARTFNAAAFTLAGMQADVLRDASGALNLAQLIKAPQATKPSQVNQPPLTSAPAPASTVVASSPDWVANLGRVALEDSSVAFTDASVAPKVSVRADALSLALGAVSSKFDQPIKIALSGTLNRRGKLVIDGSAAPQWSALDLAIDGQALPLAALQPYFADLLNAKLRTGRADAKGRLRLRLPTDQQALAARYTGTLGLIDFRVIDKENSADFLRWKSLAVSAIDADIDGARQDISLGKIELDDFYARAILSPAGTLNLQDVLVSRAGKKSVVPEAAGPSGMKPAPGPVAATPAPDKSVNAAANSQVIRVGQVLLRNGNINFTDNFVKPNYTANMTGMSGSVGAVASNQPAPAAIDLKGKIDDDAPVAISGSLNVLFQPMFLDIKASASDVELPRLTPYAAKYAGYEIVKGKLSMDANYKIEDQLLTAQNRVRIDQLTFGDQIDSPSATKLPVRLAVALLKDSNGQIDIDLPISGSLDDPQFSVGGVLARVFVNLISKAVTSPFALLASAFGGGGSEELAHAEFNAGSALLTPATKARLDTLAKALLDRPALKLDIIGRVDPVSDDPGLRRQALQRKLDRLARAADRRKARMNDAADADDDADAGLTDADRTRYLEQIYQNEKFDKPRNVIGFAKSLPSAQMEQLILANTTVTPDDLRALADQRAQAARSYLEDVGKISLQRIFLIAPRLTRDGIKDKGAPNRVDFALK